MSEPMIGRLSMKSRCYACLFAWVLLSGFLFSASAGAVDDSHPLRPVDTSSPRASLRNLIENFDAAYSGMYDVMTSHMEAGRLYLQFRSTASATLKILEYLRRRKIEPVEAEARRDDDHG